MLLSHVQPTTKTHLIVDSTVKLAVFCVALSFEAAKTQNINKKLLRTIAICTWINDSDGNFERTYCGIVVVETQKT